MSEFLKTTNVSKQYANHLALDKVSISVHEQSIFGLLGPNGAGKTTLIRIINRITAPDSGEVFIQVVPIRQEHTAFIGYLPEERGLYKKMKVGEQALYLAQLKGLSKQEAMKRLNHWFKRMEISSWWNKKVEELSKGMAQKIQFITTVIHEPKLLIFDEPFSGFDPINVNILKEEILRLRAEGATIIFSTHNMASVEELCDHIVLINKSRTILEGKVSEIKQEYKDNLFEVSCASYDGNPQQHLPSLFEVQSSESENGLIKYRIRVPQNTRPNELLSRILPHAEVHGFNEILPSMNEIFIRKVSETNQRSAVINS